jgi:hypothetical protein
MLDEKITAKDAIQDFLLVRDVAMMERSFNDDLLESESLKHTEISRRPVLMSLNYPPSITTTRSSIFRLMELGIPVVILPCGLRGIQSSYRWVKKCLEEMAKAHLDMGMLSFLCCEAHQEEKFIMKCAEFASLIVDARKNMCDLLVKSKFRNIIGISGRLTTFWSSKGTPIPDGVPVSTAVKKRFIVAEDDDIYELYKQKHADYPSQFSVTIVKSLDDINKHYIFDFSKGNFEIIYHIPKDGEKNDINLNSLCRWLLDSQPQYLFLNVVSSRESTQILERLFSSTLVSGISLGYSLAAATQQYGEILPGHLKIYGLTPVVVPYSLAYYCSNYDTNYISDNQFIKQPEFAHVLANPYCRTLLSETSQVKIRNYMALVAAYLLDLVEINPKRGSGPSLDVFWGIQKLPYGYKRILRMGVPTLPDEVRFDMFALYYLPFYMTDAHEQVIISLHPSNFELMKVLDSVHLEYKVQYNEEYLALEKDPTILDTVKPAHHFDFRYPLVDQFIATLHPFGHVKLHEKFLMENPTEPDAKNMMFKHEKWLKIRIPEITE